MGHLYKTYAHVLVAFGLALFAGAGIDFTGGLLAAAVYVAVSAVFMLAGGVGSLIVMRRVFDLMQAGKIIQFGTFVAVWSAVAFVGGLLAPSVVTVSSPLLVGAVMLISYLVTHTLTGEIAMYKHRSWLPMRRKGTR